MINRYLDARYELDTDRIVTLDDLGTDPELCHGYVSTDWFSLKDILKKLNIKPTDTFLDLGSGKGRMLLVASGFPFRKIIGVEISKELCELANKNVQNYLMRRKTKCRNIEIVNMNASAYQILSEVSVVFFQSSFPAKTFDLVLDDRVSSFKTSS